MGWLAEQFGFSADTQAKLIASVAVVGILVIGRWLVLRAVQRRFQETWVAYRAKKVATITATIVGLAIFAWIWIDAFNDVATFLGLLSAGIAIALADVLKNMAGWVYILSRRPFRVGDRIEIGSTKGDVVDIRAHPRSVEKGDLLGWFNMGSTVILLFPDGACDWDHALHSGQTLRMGETIGTLTEAAQ